MSNLHLLQIFSLICFYGYGFSCLFSKKMVLELQRYGLSQFRVLTGALQVLRSTGLLMGFFFHPLTVLSSLGLSVLMLLGVAVRLKIRDPFLQIVPAFAFMCINFLIFWFSV